MPCLIRHNHTPLALRVALLLSVTAFNAVAMAAGKEDLIRDEKNAGIHKKLIISAEGVSLYDKPDGTVTRTAMPFEIFFKLWPSPAAKEAKAEDQNGWVQVGNAKGDGIGWIKNAEVKDPQTGNMCPPFIHWLSRFMLEPKAPEDSADTAKAFTVTNEAGKPLATYRGRGGEKLAFAPILDDTADADRFKVAFMLEKPPAQEGGVTVVQEGKMEKLTQDLSADLVFVIDTTASMTPLIDATKNIVQQVVDALRQASPEMQDSFRFGLVAYQDSTPGLKPFEVLSKLTDANSFQQKLASLAAGTQGSQETAEDVLAGLTAAISPDMGWGQSTAKHVILLGDASAHLGSDNPKNTTKGTIEGVLAQAKSQSGGNLENNLGTITFSAVRAIQQNNDPAENELSKSQFEFIASNAGGLAGYHKDVDPNNSAEKEDTIRGMVESFRSAMRSLGGLKRGDFAAVEMEAKKGTSAISTQIFQIAEGIKPEEIKPVMQGLASDRNSDGDLVAPKALHVSMADMKILASTLDFLYQSLQRMDEGGERSNVAILMNQLQTTVVMAELGEKGTQFDQGTSLKAVISALPLKSDALEMTIGELAGLPDDAFKAWLEKLGSTLATAKKIVDEPTGQWMALDNGDDKSESLLFRRIRVEDLP